MGIVSFGSAPSTIVGATFAPVSLAAVSFSAGNWSGETPTNLQAIADGNPNTATGWGRTAGYGNKGWIQVDLGAFYSRLYLEIKAGLKSGWDLGNADFFLEASEIPIWDIKQAPLTSSEKTLYLNIFATCQYLKMGAQDNGNGSAMFKWYSLKAWELII